MNERADRRWTDAELADIQRRVNRAHAKADQPTAPRKTGQKREYPVLPAERRVGELTLVLPWPPSANGAYRNGAHGSKVLTEVHKAFRTAVEVLAWQLGRPWLAGPLEVTMNLHPPHGSRGGGGGDIDNYLKHSIDAMQHANFFENDRSIDVLIVQRHPQHADGAVAVTLRTIEPKDPTPCQKPLPLTSSAPT